MNFFLSNVFDHWYNITRYKIIYIIVIFKSIFFFNIKDDKLNEFSFWNNILKLNYVLYQLNMDFRFEFWYLIYFNLDIESRTFGKNWRMYLFWFDLENLSLTSITWFIEVICNYTLLCFIYLIILNGHFFFDISDLSSFPFFFVYHLFSISSQTDGYTDPRYQYHILCQKITKISNPFLLNQFSLFYLNIDLYFYL